MAAKNRVGGSALPGGSSSSSRGASRTQHEEPFNPFILTSYKSTPNTQHAAATQAKPLSPYLAKPHHLMTVPAAGEHSAQNSPSGRQQQASSTSPRGRPGTAPPKRSGAQDKDPSGRGWGLEGLRADIRRLHEAMQSQGGPSAGPAAVRASGSGASGASMLKHSRDDSPTLTSTAPAASSSSPSASIRRSTSGPSSSVLPNQSLTSTFDPGDPAAAADRNHSNGAGSSSTHTSLEAELEAAGGSREALLELLSSKATQLLHHSTLRLRSDPQPAFPAFPSGGYEAWALPASSRNGAATAASSAAMPPSRAMRAQSAHAAYRTPPTGQSPSRQTSHTQAPSASSMGVPAASEPALASAPSSVASALLDSLSLLSDLQRQASSKGVALRAAEEQAAEAKSRLELSQQDNTLLRNIVAELQAGARLYGGGAAGGEPQRPASARPASGADSPKPDLALLKQVQSLGKEVSELRRQLEAATRQLEAATRQLEAAAKKARQQQADLDAASASAEAARKALAASEAKESKAVKERDQAAKERDQAVKEREQDRDHAVREQDQLSARCRQLESDLAQAISKCDRLSKECGELERLREEAAVGSRADVDERIRAQAADLDALRSQLQLLRQQLGRSQEDLESSQGKLEGSLRAIRDLEQRCNAAEQRTLEQEGKLREAEAEAAAAAREQAAAEARAQAAGAAAAEAAAAADSKAKAARGREQALQAELDRARADEREARAGAEREARGARDAAAAAAAAREALAAERDALAARLAALAAERGGLEASVAERGARLHALEAVAAQVSELEAALRDRDGEAAALRQKLLEANERWERGHLDLEAERRRLQEEWEQASALRASLQQEAAAVKAMGTLVQAKTLKFDLSGMMAVSGAAQAQQQQQQGAAVGGGQRSSGNRPMSAILGGEGVAAAQMRLGALVKELQETVALQGGRLAEKQREVESLQKELMRLTRECDEAGSRGDREAEVQGLRVEVDGLRGQLAKAVADTAAREREMERAVAAAEERGEQEAATLKGVNKELHKMSERLQRQLNAKSQAVEQLEAQVVQLQAAAVDSQQQQQQQQQQPQHDLDYEKLLQQLQATRANLVMCSEKLEGAEKTIHQQDERIALLQSRVKTLEDEADAATFSSALAVNGQAAAAAAAAASNGAGTRPSPAAFAGSGALLRNALGSDDPKAVARGGYGGGVQHGFVMRPSSASLVGKVLEREGGNGYVARSANGGAGAQGSGGAGRGSSGAGSSGGVRPLSAVTTVNGGGASTGGCFTGRGAGAVEDASAAAAGERHATAWGSPHAQDGSGATFSGGSPRTSPWGSPAGAPVPPRPQSSVAHQPRSTVAAGGAPPPRPSTAVTRKTLVLLSKSSYGLDEDEGPGGSGEWTPV